MKFELGKCYEHTTGKQLHVCGTADTFLYGETLVAEQGHKEKNVYQTDLMCVGGDSESYTVNWKEISKQEFLDCNYTE